MNSKITNVIQRFKQHLDERAKYLKFCSKEAQRIADILIEDCLEDVTASGYSLPQRDRGVRQGFLTRTPGLVVGALRSEGSENIYR